MSGPTYRWEASARIAQRRLVAIVRHADTAVAEQVGDAVIAAGLDVLEVPLTTPDALGAIERLSRRHPQALVGAGTVLDESSARLAILAGARFLVSPRSTPRSCGPATATAPPCCRACRRRPRSCRRWSPAPT